MRWTHLLGLLLVAGCSTPPSVNLFGIAEGYVRVSLQLAQHDPSLVESWRGSEAWRPGSRVPVTTLLATIAKLQVELEQAPSAERTARHRYLAAQLQALRFAARRLLGEDADLDEQAREEFGIELSVLEPARMAEVRAAIADALPGSGSIVERFQALRAASLIANDVRPAAMEAALSACRGATIATLPLPLPAGERVTVAFTPGLGWDGHASYAGGGHTRIEVNADGLLDVSRALRLACHEGYPGHHVQHLLFEQTGWAELELSPGFGPHLLFTEGAAEAGAELAFSASERARLYREQLLPRPGSPATNADALATVDALIAELHPIVTDVARQYLSGALSKERAIERLRDEALILNPEGTLALIERRRARALVYGEGRRAVYARLKTRDLKGLASLFSSQFELR